MFPILAVDVAKASSHAAIFLNNPTSHVKSFEFFHNDSGIQKVFTVLDLTHKQTGIKPIVVMESKGNYSKVLCHQCMKRGFVVHVFNPLLTNQVKRSSIRKIKTDPIDVNRIAHVFYTKETKPYDPGLQIQVDLKIISRQYDGLSHLMTDHSRNKKSFPFVEFKDLSSISFCISKSRFP